MSEALVALLRARLEAPGGAQGFLEEHDAAQEREAALPQLRARAWGKKRAAAGGEGRQAARELLRTLLRRLSGRAVVRGRLLNVGELQVAQLALVGAADGCVSIAASDVKLVVRCVGAAAAQVGQQHVVARVVAPDDARVQALLAEEGDIEVGYDAFVQHGAQPIALVSATDEDVGAEWAKETALEDMTSVFGFSPSAFESLQRYTLPDREGEPTSLNEHIRSLRSFRDLRASEKMMEHYGIPTDSFQSLALRRERPSQQDGQTLQDRDPSGAPGETAADPWSYQELDAAQKRKWADERYEYGLELVEKRKLREAIAEFDSAFKLHDRHAKALAAKGRAFMAMHQLQDAVDCLEQAAKIDPSVPAVSNDLLRAKGALGHSRHVSVPAKSSMPTTSILKDGDRMEPRKSTVRRESSRDSRHSSRNRDYENDRRSTASGKTLEEDRLRRLLEEEIRQKKRSHRSRRSRRSDSDRDSDSDTSNRSRSRERSRSSSKKRKREKKHKKEKRSHKKHSRKKSRKSHRYDSDSSASDSHSSDTSRQRGRKHESDNTREAREQNESLPAILSRTKHRIWN